jgi:HAD superfamily hydrolase (TIGR01549 family)
MADLTRAPGHATRAAGRSAHPPRPKAVVFDLWNTLIESDGFSPSRGNARLLELAGNHAPLDALLAYEAGILRDIERREDESHLEFTRQSLQRLLNDRFEIRSPLSLAEQEWEYWSKSMEIRLVDGVTEALDDLARRSIRRAVISNSSFTADTIRRTLADLGVLDQFEFVVSSADYGVRKPHLAIFEAALARLGLAAGEAWFAGDNVAYDLEGGLAAGMFTVLFRPPDNEPPGLEGSTCRPSPGRQPKRAAGARRREPLASVNLRRPGYGYSRIGRWSDLAVLLDRAGP